MKPFCSILSVLACAWGLAVSPALAQQSVQARIDLWKTGEWTTTDSAWAASKLFQSRASNALSAASIAFKLSFRVMILPAVAEAPGVLASLLGGRRDRRWAC